MVYTYIILKKGYVVSEMTIPENIKFNEIENAFQIIRKRQEEEFQKFK